MNPWEAVAQQRKGKGVPWQEQRPSDPMELGTERDYQSRELNLPTPHEGMFDGMDREDVEDLKDAYRRHPNSTSSTFGGITYNGQNVPESDAITEGAKAGLRTIGTMINPTARLWDEVTGQDNAEQLPEGIAGGAWNGVRNLVGTSAALQEKAGDLVLGDYNPYKGQTEVFNEATPKYESTTRTGAMGQLGGEIGVGVLAGNKLAAGAKGLAATYKMAENALHFLGSVAGGAASMDVDTHPMITGKNSEYANLLDAVSLDDTGNYNDRYLKKRWNLMVDAAATAGVLNTAVRPAVAASEFVLRNTFGKLSAWGSFDAKKKAAAKFIMEKVLNITPDTPDDVYQRAVQDLAKDMKAAEGEVIHSGVPGIEPIEVKRDTASLISKARGADSREGQMAIGIRNSAQDHSMLDLQRKVDQPIRNLEDVTKKTDEVFGGTKAMDDTRQAIIDSAESDIAEAGKPAFTSKMNMAKSNKKLNKALTEDPLMGPYVKDSTIPTAESKQSQGLETLYQRGKQLDTATHNNRDDILDAVRGDKDISDASTVRMEIAIDKAGDSLHPDILKKIEAAGGNTKTLFTTVVRPLDKLIEKGIEKEGFVTDEIQGLKDLKKEITDAFKGTKGGRAFDEFYQDEFAPITKNSVVAEATKVEKDAGWNKAKGIDDAKKVYDRVLTYDTREQAKALRDMYIKHFGDADAVTDVPLGKLGNKLGDKLASGKEVGDLGLGDMIGDLRQMREFVQDADAAKIDKFVSTLSNAQKDYRLSEADYAKFSDILKETKENIQGRELAKFYPNGKAIDSGEEAFHVFSQYLDNPVGTKDLEGIIKRVQTSKNPDAMNGLRAAFARYYKGKVFAASGSSPSGARRVNEAFVRELQDDSSNLWRMGQMIYGEKNNPLKLFRQLSDMAGEVQTSKSIVKKPIPDVSRFDKEAAQGLNFLITQIRGNLDRLGSRLRSISGRAVEANQSQEDVIRAYQMVLENPDEFYKAVEGAMGDQFTKLNKGTRAALRTYVSQNMIYGAVPGVSKPLEGLIGKKQKDDNKLDDKGGLARKKKPTDIGTVRP